MEIVSELTKKEKEVYDLIVEGLSDSEIAKKLIIALSTVATHKNRIFQKLLIFGQKRRIELIVKHYRAVIETKEYEIEVLKNGQENKDMENI